MNRLLHFGVILLLICVASGAGPATAPTEPSFEKEIRAFEKADRQAPPPRDAVLFVGSSSIRLWNTLQDDFPDVPVINRGFGGSRIADSTRYADRIVLPYEPREIVMYAGDNDIAAGRSPRQVLEDFRAFVEKVRPALPHARICFISIKPSLARWKLVDRIKEANRLVAQYAAHESDVQFIDIFTPMLGPDEKPRRELFRDDGLHLNRRGYELWTTLIRPHLVEGSPRSHGDREGKSR